MVNTITRTFLAIEFMAEHNDWISLRAMARELEINEASMFRVLNALKNLGYVRQHPQSSEYQLTLKITGISAQLLGNVRLREIAHPFLKNLTSETNETTHLAIMDGNEFVYIDKADNFQAMQMRSRIGQRGLLHCTAAGKALVAFYPEEDRPKLLDSLDLQSLTKHTITDLDDFKEQLVEVRRDGYALDNEENEIGIRCIGAPIFDHTGVVAGALSISGWTISMTPERMPALADELLEVSQQISNELGYRDEPSLVSAITR